MFCFFLRLAKTSRSGKGTREKEKALYPGLGKQPFTGNADTTEKYLTAASCDDEMYKREENAVLALRISVKLFIYSI